MSWRHAVGYWSVIGMATKSSRFEQSMNQNLVLMSEATLQSSILYSSSAENQEKSIEASKQAAADEAEATELEEEAVALLEKSEADFALAAADEVELEEVEAEIVAEEEQGAVHAAAAAADEVTFETETAEATADASEAFELEAEANGEEVGIAVCEFIPILDVVCDVVGGITVVGLEWTAGVEAAKSAAEFTAAAAAKAEEEREIATEAEIQAKVAEDGVVAVGLRDEEAELEEKAEAERLQGEEKQAASDALYDKAEVEEEAAAELEVEAVGEAAAANEQAQKALSHGVQSCWDAIMAATCGALSLMYFAFRLTATVVVPAACKTYAAMTTTTGTERIAHFFSLRNISYFIQHALIFLSVTELFSNELPELDQNSLKARGGIILLFGFTGSFFHTILLHLIPEHCAKSQIFYYSLFRTLLRLLAFSCLFTLEMLIIWVTLGQQFFSKEPLNTCARGALLLFFIAIITCHIACLEIPTLQQSGTEYDEAGVVGNVCHVESQEYFDMVKSHNERDTLLPVASRHAATKNDRSDGSALLWAWFKNDFGFLKFPFEVLILACMFGILHHCIPSVLRLWPISKDLILAAKPGWLVPLLSLLAVLFVLAVVHSATRKKTVS